MSAPPAGSRPEARPPELATLTLSAGGCITSWSESAGRLLGAELRAGRTVMDLFPGAAGALLEHLRPGVPARAFCVAPAGARAGQALALAAIPGAGDSWEAVLLSLVGGSGREAEVLSALLHDLRTPLTTLLGAVELLESGRLGALPERAANLFEALKGAGKQITGMLEKAAERRDAPAAGDARGKG